MQNNKNKKQSSVRNNYEKELKSYDDNVDHNKIITLKGLILNNLERLAAQDGRKIKPFIEKILKEYSNNNK